MATSREPPRGVAMPWRRSSWKRGGLGTLSALALLAQLVEHLHGKEGVDGSSPSEGLKYLQMSPCVAWLGKAPEVSMEGVT